MAENFLLEDGRLVYAKAHVIGGRSGVMTGIAAGAHLFTIRVPTGAEPLIVSQLEVTAWSESAFTAAQSLAFTLYKLVGFTALQSGGVNIAATRKRTTDTAALGADVEAKIAAAAALTGGTFTAIVATEPLGAFVCDVSVSGAGSFCQGRGVWTPKNRIPIALEPNEGIVLINEVAMGAGGTVRLVAAADTHKA